jgi:AcrR family transcriptional regulator
MARIVKDPDVRRSEILDVAQRFFYQNGYEQTSIQDIITEIGIAKGTFYHYFRSKQDLLDELIDRMVEQTLQSLEPVVADEQLSGLEKLERFFGDIANWKGANKAFFLDLLRIWYKDENAILRHKVQSGSAERTIPLLAEIIEQGRAEGSFATDDPVDVASIVLQVGQSLSDTLAKILLCKANDDDTPVVIARKVIIHERAIERVLGAPPESLKLFDLNAIKFWFE